MNESKTKVMVYFTAYADHFDLSEVTQKLGINPTKSWLKGDIIREKLRRKNTAWEFSTGYVESLDVNEQMSQIINKLKDKVPVLLDLKKRNGLEYGIIIVIVINNGYTPALGFDNSAIEFLHLIGADVDIDLYANPFADDEKNSKD